MMLAGKAVALMGVRRGCKQVNANTKKKKIQIYLHKQWHVSEELSQDFATV